MKTNLLPLTTTLTKEFPFVSKDEINYQKKNNKYKTERGFLNFISRINADYQRRAEMPDVLTLEFEGGVGESCYYSIAAFLGGKLEHVADGQTYDKYVFTFGKKGGVK